MVEDVIVHEVARARDALVCVEGLVVDGQQRVQGLNRVNDEDLLHLILPNNQGLQALQQLQGLNALAGAQIIETHVQVLERTQVLNAVQGFQGILGQNQFLNLRNVAVKVNELNLAFLQI